MSRSSHTIGRGSPLALTAVVARTLISDARSYALLSLYGAWWYKQKPLSRGRAAVFPILSSNQRRRQRS